MSFIQIILTIIKYGPALYDMIVEIIEMIQNLTDDEEAKKAKEELEKSVIDYKKTKDRKRLRKLREDLRNKCDAC